MNPPQPVSAPRLDPHSDAALLAAAFLTPQRAPAPSAAQAWLARACVTHVPFDERAPSLPSWRWGEASDRVLLVHGWDGRGSDLVAFVPVLLAAGFGVITFDGPAHGDAPGLQASPAHHARAVRVVAAHHGGVRAVVAHAVGSAAALGAFRDGLEVQASVQLAAPSSVRDVALGLARMTGLAEAEWPAYLAHIEDFAGAALSDGELPALAPDLRHRALLLHDPQDREVAFAGSLALHRAWPGSRLQEVPGVGHRRLLSESSVVAAAAGFIASVLRPAPTRAESALA